MITIYLGVFNAAIHHVLMDCQILFFFLDLSFNFRLLSGEALKLLFHTIPRLDLLLKSLIRVLLNVQKPVFSLINLLLVLINNAFNSIYLFIDLVQLLIFVHPCELNILWLSQTSNLFAHIIDLILLHGFSIFLGHFIDHFNLLEIANVELQV